MEILTGFIIGIVGSFHCLGMCGPIALALPHNVKNTKISLIANSLLYNLGRIITYALMGAAVGAIGMSVSISGYQGLLSILIGSGMLLYSIQKVLKLKRNLKFISFNPLSKFYIKLKKIFSEQLLVPKKSTLLIIGLLTGLLPCGLVYTALAASLAAGDILNSSLTMSGFGLGTFPMMSAIYLSKNFIKPDLKSKLNKLVPIGLVIVSIIIIFRGLSLGIPLISPELNSSHSVKSECCH